MKEIATVKEVNGNKVIVQKARLEACSTCSANCVGKASGEKIVTMTALRNDVSVDPADTVEIEITDFSATKVAALLYGLPLAVFVTVLLFFSGTGQSVGISALIAFGAMAGVYSLIAVYDRKNRARFMPIILRKVDNDNVFFIDTDK